MILTLENAKQLLTEAPDGVIQFTVLRDRPRKWFMSWLPRRKFFMVTKTLLVKLSNGEVVVIHEGLKTDFSSVPRLLWSVVSPFGDFALAALIHDLLYIYTLGERKEADKEMLIWSNALSKNKIDNYLRFYAVRAFGWIVWNQSKKNQNIYPYEKGFERRLTVFS